MPAPRHPLVLPVLERATARDATDRTPWVALLQDAVADGASVGFVRPLTAAAAARYWEAVMADVISGIRLPLSRRRSYFHAIWMRSRSCRRGCARRRAAK